MKGRRRKAEGNEGNERLMSHPSSARSGTFSPRTAKGEGERASLLTSAATSGRRLAKASLRHRLGVAGSTESRPTIYEMETRLPLLPVVAPLAPPLLEGFRFADHS